MYIFVDTETTGVPKNYRSPASDLTNWPRLVQLGWVITENNGKVLKEAEYIVRPSGFSIPFDAAKVHGITTELAMARGVDLGKVISDLSGDILSAELLVAHNTQFDVPVIAAEQLRCGLESSIETLPAICTMQQSTRYCAIPGPYGFKWPRLQELHFKLFGEAFDEAHSALADVKACMRCYFELRRLRVVT